MVKPLNQNAPFVNNFLQALVWRQMGWYKGATIQEGVCHVQAGKTE
jgi:hypothetical protein